MAPPRLQGMPGPAVEQRATRSTRRAAAPGSNQTASRPFSRCIRPTAAAVTAVATRVLKLMVSQGECQLATPGKIRLFTDSKASIPSNTTPAATSTAWGMWLTPTGCSVGHGKSLSSTADRDSPAGTVVAAGDVRQEVRPDRRGRPPAGPDLL